MTRASRAPGSAAAAASSSRPARALRLAVRYASDPAGTLAAADNAGRDRLKVAGAAAVVIGAAIAFVLSLAFGVAPLRGFLAMGWTAAWALVRLLILRLAAHDLGDAARGRMDDAWGPALLPYLVAVVFPLDIMALVASAALTHRGLLALEVPRRTATRAVAWAFGGQLAVEAVAWMGRASLLAFVSL